MRQSRQSRQSRKSRRSRQNRDYRDYLNGGDVTPMPSNGLASRAFTLGGGPIPGMPMGGRRQSRRSRRSRQSRR